MNWFGSESNVALLIFAGKAPLFISWNGNVLTVSKKIRAPQFFLANNSTLGTRTKHIDIKMHFIRHYIEDGIVQIEIVKSDENKSDICTKNVKPELLIKHTDGMLEETMEIED